MITDLMQEKNTPMLSALLPVTHYYTYTTL